MGRSADLTWGRKTLVVLIMPKAEERPKSNPADR